MEDGGMGPGFSYMYILLDDYFTHPKTTHFYFYFNCSIVFHHLVAIRVGSAALGPKLGIHR
jgi:hypothetical protein